MKIKCYLIILLSFVSALIVNAQYVGLTNNQLLRLNQLNKTDTTVARLCYGFYYIARKALTEKPNPRDTIISEGHLKTDPNKIASVLCMQDYNKIYALALMFKLNGDKAYFTQALNFLKAWATINRPLGHPINDTKMDRVMEAYDMLRPDILETDKQLIDAWLIDIAENEIKRMQKGRPYALSNWHSHRLKVVGQIGYILNKKDYIDYALNGLKQQIETNLNEDGTSFDFLTRDALHYHAYDLEPMLSLAIIIQRAAHINHFNYVSPKGSSIKKSMDWFLPYLTGEKTHAEYVHTKVDFDIARANNHEKGFTIGKDFSPKQGLYALSLASWFDDRYLQVLKQITQSDNDIYDWQSVINKLTKE